MKNSKVLPIRSQRSEDVLQGIFNKTDSIQYHLVIPDPEDPTSEHFQLKAEHASPRVLWAAIKDGMVEFLRRDSEHGAIFKIESGRYKRIMFIRSAQHAWIACKMLEVYYAAKV